MSVPIRSIMNKEIVENYVSICLDKTEIAFGAKISTPTSGFVPYEAKNHIISRSISEYFSTVTNWREISIEDLKREFLDEYWSVFFYIGWEGLYSLTPLLIKLGFDGYLSGDEICSTVESVLSKFPRESDDETHTFLDWIAMYDEYQILCILDMMTLISKDPLKLFRPGFNDGRRWWSRQYLNVSERAF